MGEGCVWREGEGGVTKKNGVGNFWGSEIRNSVNLPSAIRLDPRSLVSSMDRGAPQINLGHLPSLAGRPWLHC